MAGYNDTKAMIISTLIGRPAGTEIQPENQQAYELNMLDYIRSLELISSSPIISIADETTNPVQPDNARVSYIAGVAQNRTVTFQNFIGENGQPLSITTGDMEAYLVILLWNAQYWTMQAIPTNIISSSNVAYFYYNYNIRKTYASVAAMNADSVNPIGINGKPIKLGDIVSVVNNGNSSENGFYSYEGVKNGWKLQSGFNFQLVQTTGTDVNSAMSQKAVTDTVNRVYSYLKNLSLESKKTTNLYDPLDVVSGQGIENTGNIVVGGLFSNWKTSGYIPVTAGESYYLTCKTSGRSFGFQWADSNFQKISGSGDPIYNVIQTAPANAAYFMFNIADSNGIASTEVMMVQGTAAATYVPCRLLSMNQIEGLIDSINGLNGSINGTNSFKLVKNVNPITTTSEKHKAGIIAMYLDFTNSNGSRTVDDFKYLVNVVRGLSTRYELWFNSTNALVQRCSMNFIMTPTTESTSYQVIEAVYAGIKGYFIVDWSKFTLGSNDAVNDALVSNAVFDKSNFTQIDLYIRQKEQALGQALEQALGVPKVFNSIIAGIDILPYAIRGLYLDISNSLRTREQIIKISNILKNYNGRYEVWLYYSDNTYSMISFPGETGNEQVVKTTLSNGIIVYIVVDWSKFTNGINSLSGIISDWCFRKGVFPFLTSTQIDELGTQIDELGTGIGIKNLSNNLLNPNDSNVLLGYFLGGATPTVYPAIDVTGYMPVTPGKTYSLFLKPGASTIMMTLRYVNFYDSNKVLLRTIQSVSSVTPIEGDAFVRVSIYNGVPPSTTNLRSLSEVSFADNSLTSAYEEYGLVEAYLKKEAGNEPNSIVDRKTLEEYSPSEYLTIENSDKILFTGCSYDESTYSLKFKSWINKLSNYIDWQCGNHAVSGQRIIDIAQRLRADVSTYGIVPTAYKPTYITIANNGNEYLPTKGESLELYVEQVRIAKEIIESLGAKMILGTNYHVNGNPYVETDLKAMAEQLGIPYMGIGWLGEKIMSHDYQGFWGGSHPGTRTNSFVWLEWLRFINQLPTPRKVIKVFRGRNSGTDVLALNYDNNWQRATIWQEINAGERSLNTADGSENFYDRLDEGTTVDPNDENHIITNYTGQSNNNEYVSLLSNVNVAFTDKVLLEFIINKVNVDKFTATIKGDSNISWYVKDNNNQDTWERIVRDAGLVFKVSKAVYDSFNDVVGTKFTSTKFANGTIQFAYWGKVKSWTMGKGYFLCFTADTSSTDKVSGSGTLVRVSDSTTVDFINHMTAYRYSYDYFSRIHKPKGKFVAINSTYDALTGLYTIIIENQKYFQYDRVKLIGVKAGSFNISKVEAKYDGGQTKVYKTENVTMKKQLKELITTRGFDTGWDSTGGWINENNQLVEMPADVDSYPPYLTVKKHVVLALDSVDGFPQKIKRTFTVESSRAYKKILVRLVSRLFPLIYNVDKTGTYYTATPQISKTSFDNAVITCELGGTTPAVKHAVIDTDWSEVEFEFELPPYLTTFDLSIYRNIEISNVSPSQNWELQLADVSLQIEDY